MDYFAAIGSARSGDVVLVASDRRAASALERARAAGVATEHFNARDDGALGAILRRYGIDVVALAGYLRLVPADLVHCYRDRMLNVHPGPLPEFGGAGMYGVRVHQAVIRSGRAYSAATVHLVDEQFDRGAILASWPVPVLPEDTPISLGARVLAAEHIIYPRMLDALCAGLSGGAIATSLT